MKPKHYLLLFIAFVPMLIFRDFTPSNELRYLSIANEAIENGNFFAFTNHGIPYADKPPLYLWIVMLGKVIFGTHSMFFLGLFSLLPAMAILYIMDKWVAGRMEPSYRISSQLSLMTCLFFIGSAVVLRMDMLMCLFIVLALHTFYRMYSGDGRKNDRWLLPVYIFMAVFTKGPVGLLVIVLSITVFLLIKGQLKTFGRYLGWKAWMLMLSLAFLWFAGVYLDGGKEYLNNLLFNQTVNRAVDSFHHKEPFYYYLVTIWYSMAPWTLLYVGAIIAGIRYRFIDTDLEKFFAVVSAATLVLLSLISSKIEIYLLPAYPFIAFLAGLLIPRLHRSGWIKLFVAVPAGILTLALPGTLVFSGMIPSVYLKIPVYIAAGLFTAGSAWGLYQLYGKKSVAKAVNAVSTGMLAAVFCASFALPSLNSEIGFGKITSKAMEIARQSNIGSYCSYRISRAENMDVYLGRPIRLISAQEFEACGESVLFVRTKDLKGDEALKDFLQGKKPYTVGQWSFVVLH